MLSWIWNPNLDVGLPATFALAAVALIGYLFGQRTRQAEQAARNAERQQELSRASGIAHQLETIAGTLRQDLASHHGRLAQFRRRLGEAQASHDDQAWKQLCGEAESMLSPTMQLAEQLSLAYDAIRQQSDALETFSQARTDPHTGVGNGRALEEKLGVLLTSASRGGAEFSIALVSIDRRSTDATEAGERGNKSQLPELARLIQTCMRDNDYVARYGNDEFVVMLPQTKLASACVFGERMRKNVVARLATTVSCGVAEYQAGDDAKSLLGRADSAFYSAKAAGGNRQFVHTGTQIREHRATGNSPPRTTEAARTAKNVLPPNPPLDTAALSLLATADAAGQ
jgi:diguanylate cyclase (GGDEF)-like protein